ncbi:endonuclease V-like [Haliotis rubra]|uniref:endonuclease V-like n=1 Tax=Haliotis rubra TaxID=36100 RepID=UPI001EE62331|nr:endonuclease V-like [Haliotis rubra]XP_046578759.1 endonuclease V-like [Haliotis rubra]
MIYCADCGILLFDDVRGKQYCKACRTAQEERNKLSRQSSCGCNYCDRNYDWNDKEFSCSRKSTASEKSKPRPLRTPREALVDEGIRTKWEKEQMELKRQLLTEDSDVIKSITQNMKKDRLKEGDLYVGGVDISFIKGDDVNACSAFVVLSYPDLEVVYEDYQMIQLTAPYIPGFLAFREVEFLVAQYRHLEQTNPEYLPHVIFVDGNGILHPRGFGLASQLGVLLDVACVGVAKTLIHVDGLENDDNHKDKKHLLKKEGDTFLLQDKSGHVLGKALKSTDSTTNPVYISVGHKISIDTAVWLVHKCSKYRIPEPTRKADLNSREYLRVHHPQGA